MLDLTRHTVAAGGPAHQIGTGIASVSADVEIEHIQPRTRALYASNHCAAAEHASEAPHAGSAIHRRVR